MRSTSARQSTAVAPSVERLTTGGKRADGSADGTIFIPTKNAGQAYVAGLGGVTVTVSSWDTHDVPEKERFPAPDFKNWKQVYWNLPDTVGVMSHGYRRAGNKSDTL